MDYNTSRKKMILPEYGRNIQKMVDYTLSIESPEQRNQMARSIISIMGNLNPHLRDINDFKHKLWDHLAIMADFKLEIDSPYPIPTKESLNETLKPLPYNNGRVKYKFLGKTIEKMIHKASEFDEGEEKELLIEVIANHMKKSYLMWNKDIVNDDVIFNMIEDISEGKLKRRTGLRLTDSKEIVAKNKKKKQVRKDSDD